MRILFTISQTGYCLNIGRTKTYELVQTGELQLVKIGSASRITGKSIKEYLAKIAGKDSFPDSGDELSIEDGALSGNRAQEASIVSSEANRRRGRKKAVDEEVES